MNNIAFIALGSNIGLRQQYLREALEQINAHPQIQIVDFSSLYETDPVGYTDQGQFLNMVIKVKTNVSPLDLLSFLQSIELNLGRKRETRWGPRTIDLDILLYNHENIETERLILPHPRMWERAFVLIPLVEIAEKILKELAPLPLKIDQLPDNKGVRIWKRKNGVDVYELFEN